MDVHCAVQAKWIIPVDTDGDRSTCRVLHDHTLCLDCEGRISSILPNAKFAERFAGSAPPGGVKVMPPRHVIIPGLINGHTHAGMTLLRGFAEDVPLDTWLDKLWEVEHKFLGKEFVEVSSSIAAYESLKSGTTFINDMYFMPEAAELAFRRARIRSALGEALINLDDRSDKHEQVNAVMAYAKKKTTSLVQPTVTVHSCYKVPEDWLALLASEMSKNTKMKRDQKGRRHPPNGIVHIKLHETEKEIEDVARQHQGRSAIQILDNIGLVNERLVAVHCVYLTDAEIAMFAQRRVSVVHCPKSNMKMGAGICPVAKLLKAGVNVCLGTDSACSNNSLDVLSEMRFAALLAKGSSKNPQAIDDYTTLRMATRNGARAMGRLSDIGSLEVGKRGDFVAVSLDGFEMSPIFDPLSHLVYTSQPKVTAVWVGGQQVVKQGECLTIKPPLDRMKCLLRPLKEMRNEMIPPQLSTVAEIASIIVDVAKEDETSPSTRRSDQSPIHQKEITDAYNLSYHGSTCAPVGITLSGDDGKVVREFPTVQAAAT